MYESYGLGATNIGICSNPFLCPTSKPSVGPNYYDASKPAPKPIAPAPAPASKPVITALPVTPNPLPYPIGVKSTATPVLKGLNTTATPAASDSAGAAGGGQTTLSPFPMIEPRITGGGMMQMLAPTSSTDMDVVADAGMPSWLWLVLAGGAFLMLKSSKRKR